MKLPEPEEVIKGILAIYVEKLGKEHLQMIFDMGYRQISAKRRVLARIDIDKEKFESWIVSADLVNHRRTHIEDFYRRNISKDKIKLPMKQEIAFSKIGSYLTPDPRISVTGLEEINDILHHAGWTMTNKDLPEIEHEDGGNAKGSAADIVIGELKRRELKNKNIPISAARHMILASPENTFSLATETARDMTDTFECHNCGGHVNFDAVLLSQSDDLPSCPYC